MEGDKSKEQKRTICNIETLFRARSNVIKLFDNYPFIVSEYKYETSQEKRLKLSTPK